MKFYPSEKTRAAAIAMPVIQIVFGIIAIMMNFGIGALFIGAGITILTIHFVYHEKPLIVLNSDYLELKVTPLAPKHLIRYADIRKVVTVSPAKGHLLIDTTNGEEKVGLPLAALADDDKTSLFNELEERSAPPKRA